MAQEAPPLNRWAKLKLWVGNRHDFLEREYEKNRYSADQSEKNVFFAVYQAMLDIERAEAQQQSAKAQRPTGPRNARGGK